MPTYHRESWVNAPLDDVWEFHSRIAGLEALTPSFLHLRVDSVTGPDGTPDPDVLDVGTRIEASLRPFGIGPRLSWTSVVTEREFDGDRALFADRMEEGPFPRWEHTHRFFGVGGKTLVSDRVDYDLPGGDIGDVVSPLSGPVGFAPMFRFRHRETRRRLE